MAYDGEMFDLTKVIDYNYINSTIFNLPPPMYVEARLPCSPYSRPGDPRRDFNVLREALDTVRRGWCQGTRQNAQGEVCLGEALYRAARGDSEKMEHAARLLGFSTLGQIPEWNDRLGRTQAEVVGRLQNAILRLEASLPSTSRDYYYNFRGSPSPNYCPEF